MTTRVEQEREHGGKVGVNNINLKYLYDSKHYRFNKIVKGKSVVRLDLIGCN